MSIFLAILVLFSALIHHNDCSCLSDGKVNGCSVPFKSSFPYSRVFRPACNRHDVCYRCGSLFLWPRLDCDNGFLNDMLEICDEREATSTNMSDEFGLSACRSAAKAYKAGVRLLGFLFYRKKSPKWCSADQCVKKNGLPNL